jgi:hypothetical protein
VHLFKISQSRFFVNNIFGFLAWKQGLYSQHFIFRMGPIS